MTLSIISSKRRLRRFLTYDLEWVPGTLKVRVVGCYDGHRFRHYKNVADFLDAEMNSDNRGAWFYAHAGGLADVQFIFEEVIKRREFKIEASFSGSSAIIVKVKKGKNVWTFVDSYWLMRDSLANIGKWMGRPKTGPKLLDGATQESIKRWYAEVPMKELVEYNSNDCELLWEAIDVFENTILEIGGQLQPTIASCAMHLFRRKYLTREIGTSENINERVEKAYFASRVEVLAREGRGYYYDINSSFPHSMTSAVPGDLTLTLRRIPDYAMDPDCEPWFADVDIEIPDLWLPPIPTRNDGRVVFPTGNWSSWLSWIDIQLLVREGGRVTKVREYIQFDKMFDLAEYATDLYERRKGSSDHFERTAYKLLLNSLYGKFAESPDKDKLHVHPTLDKLLSLDRDNMLMPGVWLEPVVASIPHRHVPISAAITARARQKLYDYMIQSNDVHYCDTDGFSTTDTFETSNELGDLKLEKLIEIGKFYAPKVYRIDGTVNDGDGWKPKTIVKAKGFSLGKGQEAIDRFEQVVSGHAIEVERMARLRENLRRGISKPWEAKIEKRLREVRDKRFFYPDGQSRPWHTSELI